MELKEYLESKGIEGHEQGQNLVFDCPFCADERQRCGININPNHAFFNQWNCFNCPEKGKSIKSFQKAISKLNDEDVREKIEIRESEKEDEQEFEVDQKLALKHFNKAQKPKRKALDYLRDERGFSKATINHFMLGSKIKKKYEYVSIPFWENGELVNIKYRAVSFKDKKFKWLRITGGKTALFHDEAIDTMDRKEIYICEAELDAMALWNAGIKNVVAMSAGAKHSIPHEWYDRVEKFENIYLVFDNDVDGQAGAEKMSTRLGMDRCFNIVLPNDEIIEDRKKTKLKDLNQYFWDKDKKKDRYSIKKFKKLSRASTKFKIKDVMSLTETFHELIKDKYTCNEDELFGFPTPWKKVNDILPAPKPGMLIVVTASPKVGKTSWVLNYFLGVAGPDCPCHIECYEMRQKRIAEKTIAYAVTDYTTVENITELQIREARFANPSDYIFLGYPSDGDTSFEKLREKIIKVVQRYGVKLFCVDHLHFLVRGDNVKDKIGEITRGLKVLAEMLGIVIVLVAQPRKVENNRVPTPKDLKGSSSIVQDLDSLVILHRNLKTGDDFEKDSEEAKGKLESVTQVHVISRWGDGGQTLLYFKGQKSKYYEKGIGYDKEVGKFIEKRKAKHKRKKL